MPKGVQLKPEQIVAKLREIEVKIGQGKDVLSACIYVITYNFEAVLCATLSVLTRHRSISGYLSAVCD